ncbi:MAG: PQQ-dependent sugar dehydrogenase [Chloroflexi bacterium]|nr:PQQ-dependent sugar dehydrogenase [Chloroflexota bacterium]
MPRIRPLIALAAAVVLAGALVSGLVFVRSRARAQSDWLQGKNLTLEPVVKGLKEPTYVAEPPDGTKRLFVLERAGAVRVADSGGLKATPFLDLTGQVSTGTEEGLIGLAFDPNFKTNGYVYIDYTANDASVQVIRYTVTGDHPDQVDPSTAETVLALPKKSKYHNGGMLAFGPDGYLYIAIGDDEASEKAQDLSTVTGKILRVDVSSLPYTIPSSNPFVSREGARGEIWAYGLRNPWRFSFDRVAGDMWIGDVGDATWEEVNMLPAGYEGGANFGWPYYEGAQCNVSEHCNDPDLIMPVVTYDHNMNCAVMGGYVYRGPSAPGLVGSYLYGDLCTGGIFTVRDGKRVELGYNPIKVSSFGEDQNGDVYVCDLQGGVIYRIAGGSLP